ncbi:hypothetical protein C8R46DRAFT_1217133 [Mycena filopes]|nr:hypothetical protein C8R46DRAFT_1217133 [Mycena filopes]
MSGSRTDVPIPFSQITWIHANIFVLLIPMAAHLFTIASLAWPDAEPGNLTTLASAIVAIIHSAVISILSNKYGVTAPVHEAFHFVFTVHVAALSCTSQASWTRWNLLPYIYVALSIPITRSIWKTAMHWGALGNAARGGESPWVVRAVAENRAKLSVDKSDGGLPR